MNNPAWFIARRYFLSRKLPGVVNVVTLVAVTGIAVGTAALVIVLAVFNGFHSLIRNMYQAFDADIRVEAAKGKYFEDSPALQKKIAQTEDVIAVSRSLEGRAILRYYERQRIVKLKGVDAAFNKTSNVKSLLQGGKMILRPTEEGIAPLVLGSGVAYYVNADLENFETPMELFTVTDKRELMAADPERALNRTAAVCAGVFTMQKEYDELFALSDISVARRLFETETNLSAYEIKLRSHKDVAEIKENLEKTLGPSFRVLTWYEQHETLYELMETEKKVGYLVIALMLALTGSNIVGCLLMIVYEKRKEIAMLSALGASQRFIAVVFLLEGWTIAGFGAGAGLCLGTLFNVLQAEFGILKLNDGSAGGGAFLVDAFPVEQRPTDVLLVALTVFALSTLSALYPALRAGKLRVAYLLKG